MGFFISEVEFILPYL